MYHWADFQREGALRPGGNRAIRMNQAQKLRPCLSSQPPSPFLPTEMWSRPLPLRHCPGWTLSPHRAKCAEHGRDPHPSSRWGPELDHRPQTGTEGLSDHRVLWGVSAPKPGHLNIFLGARGFVSKLTRFPLLLVLCFLHLPTQT